MKLKCIYSRAFNGKPSAYLLYSRNVNINEITSETNGKKRGKASNVVNL